MKTYKKIVEIQKPLLEIRYDTDPAKPRADTNLGYFISKSSYWTCPDNNDLIKSIVIDTGDEANSREEHMDMIKKEFKEKLQEKVIAIYPVVMYEHGGVSYSLGVKNGFDYSNNGFYIVTDKTLKENGKVSKKDFERIIKAELKVYNAYANGDCYRYTLYNDKGEEVDSGGVFYDIDEIKGNLPKEWQKENLSDYLID